MLFEVDTDSLMPTISGSGTFTVNTSPPNAPAFVPPALPSLGFEAAGFRLSSTTETMTQSLSNMDDTGTVDSTATLNTVGSIGVNMTETGDSAEQSGRNYHDDCECGANSGK